MKALDEMKEINLTLAFDITFEIIKAMFPCEMEDGTEVGRAPLIDFQKLFLDNVFFRWKLFRKFKFYT